jgi:hypothetical protein
MSTGLRTWAIAGRGRRLAALAVLLLGVSAARVDAASYFLLFQDPGSGLSAFGLVEATPNPTGVYRLTSGTLTVVSGPVAAGTYTLITNPVLTFISPAGVFVADNQIVVVATPVLTWSGLLFGNIAGHEVNIWANSPTTYAFYGYVGTGTFQSTENATLSLIPVP